jgi:hypothetical protein
LRWNESDLAATMVHQATMGGISFIPPTPSGKLFRGYDHLIPPWNTPIDPGIFRPASLTQEPHTLAPWDPATSAFFPVQEFRSPLSAEEHDILFVHHPYGTWLSNSIRFGFALLSNTPIQRRASSSAFRGRIDYDAGIRQALQAELKDGSFVHLPEKFTRTQSYIRLAPFFGVPKSDGSTRGVSDMSAGDHSVNYHTIRASFSKLRLAKLDVIIQRIRYMMTKRPGIPIVLAKLDVSRAFRQCAIPVRDFVRSAHRFGDNIYVNSRLMMGAKASGDSMACGISAVRDILADEFGIFSEAYIDDLMFVMYVDEAPQTMATALDMWRRLGWPFNTRKLLEDGQPSTVKVFLGLEIDTVARTVRLPDDRRDRIVATMSNWLTESKDRSPSEYSQLAGKLSFACTVVPFGRSFLRALYRRGAVGTMRSTTHGGPLAPDVEFELRWWRRTLLQGLPAADFGPRVCLPLVTAYTDASGNGFGAYSPDTQAYICGPWLFGGT